MYLLPHLRQVSVAFLPLPASVPQPPSALGVHTFAEKVALKGGFLEDTVLESNLEAGEVQRYKE